MFIKNKALVEFKLAKSVENGLYFEIKQNYRKNFEKSLIISLITIIILFRIVTISPNENRSITDEDIKLTLIDILNVPPEIENPPELKVEEVVEIPPEENQAEEEDPMLEELKELLEEKEDVKLTINSDEMGRYLADNSPLGLISDRELKLRRSLDDAGGGIAFKGGKSLNQLLAESRIDLDIGTVKRSERELTNEEATVNLAAPKDESVEQPFNNSKENAHSDDVTLGLSNSNEKIISYTSSTIGTEDYKLWNKLNAELERVSQGRYGPIPKEIKRSKTGFTLTFRYSDGTKHEIHWRKSGRIWIKVIGNSHKSTVQELRRSLKSVLSLTLK
jgi:hypothetical protein